MAHRATLSIVIPFFDEFIFLNRSIGTVLAAKEAVSEIILVSDSPFGLTKKLLEPLQHIAKIRVLHNPKNLGAAETRNRGLEAATGDYVMFLDADDAISPKGLADALKYAVKHKAEVLHLPSFVEAPDAGIFYNHYRDSGLFGRRSFSSNIDDCPELRYAVANWSFMFSTKFLVENGIKFDPKQRVAEDHLFIIQAVQNAERIATFDQWCHVWRRRGGSLTTSVFKMSDQRAKLASLRKSLTFLQLHYELGSTAFQRDYAFSLTRFIWGWDFLHELILRQEVDGEAQALLEGLSMVLTEIPLNASIFSDKLYQKMLPSPLYTNAGRLISPKKLPELFAHIASQNWSELLTEIQPITEKSLNPTAHEIPPLSENRQSKQPIKFLFAPFCEVECAESPRIKTIASIVILDQQNDLIEETLTSLSDSDELVLILTDPAPAMWAEYAKNKEKNGSNDQRSFAEFILDKIDTVLGTPIAIAQMAARLGIRTRAVLIDSYVSPHTISAAVGLSECDKLIVKQNENSFLRPAAEDHLSVETETPALDRVAEAVQDLLTELVAAESDKERASIATLNFAAARWKSFFGNNFADLRSAETAEGGTYPKGLIGALWQAAEETSGASGWDSIASQAARQADSMRFNDVNLYGKKTIRSRAKAYTKRVKRAVSA